MKNIKFFFKLLEYDVITANYSVNMRMISLIRYFMNRKIVVRSIKES